VAKKKRHEEEEHENEERWLVTYADMITLLMVLFIVLFSMATIDAHKFNQLRDSLAGKHESQSVLQGSNSVINGGDISKLDSTPANPTPSFDLPSLNSVFSSASSQQVQQQEAQQALQSQQAQQAASQAEKNNLEQVQQEVQASLQSHGLADQVKFTIDRRGLVVTVVTDKVLFPSGSAALQSKGDQILDAIGGALTHVPNDISVEGYTDDQAIHTSQFPSNWELSTARATSVLRYLVDHGDVAPDKIGAAGYGQFRPAVPNDSAAHRAQNRRVEIVVLSNVDPTATGSDNSSSSN
jgi:chemotaxis protein MotB